MFSPTSENLERRNRLVERLKEVPIGQVIGLSDIAELTHGKPHIFNLAKDIVEKTHGAMFQNVRGIGYRRIEGKELPQIGVHARKRVGRTVSIARRRLSNGTKRANDLDRETRLRVNQELGVLGVLEMTAKEGL